MSGITADLNYLSASEALQHFSSGRLSPVELLDAVLDQADDITDTVNPFADRFFEQARQNAQQSEARYLKGNPLRLDGIPLLIKDSVSIKGTRATVGSLMNADHIDTHSDPSVERLLRAGAVVAANPAPLSRHVVSWQCPSSIFVKYCSL